jgi:hypothetical protein
MKKTPRKIITILIHGFFIWALCGATIGIGRVFMKMKTVLIIHAIAAPLFTAAASAVYFRRFSYTKPLTTAILFLLFVMLLDAGLVAPVFEKSFVMFKSLR